MKRFLALLLALLLPGCAIAETVGVSLSLEVNEAVAAEYAKQVMLRIPQLEAVDMDALASAAAKTLNGLSLDMAVQDDAMAIEVGLAKGELLNMTLYTVKDLVYLTSPMLSGYALWDALPNENEFPISESDLKSVLNAALKAFTAWLSKQEPTVVYGAFDGDAYSGGTKCATWAVSDKDIAELVDSMATEEVRKVFLDVMLSLFSVDASALLPQFDALNDRVAEENGYLYLLRVVTDDADKFIGASLTILDESSQLATLSLGATEQGYRLVVGSGFDEQNYWWELHAKQTRDRNVTYLSGTSCEWMADKLACFSYISTETEPVVSQTLRCTLTESGERLLWDGSICDDKAAKVICAMSGSIHRDTGAMESTMEFGGTGADAALRIKCSIGLTEPIAAMDSTLKLCCVVSPEDSALYDELTDKFTASLMARLIKLLPMDLIMNINKFTLPGS